MTHQQAERDGNEMKKTVDKTYCMSSFLTYRFTVDRSRCYTEALSPFYVPYPSPRTPIHDSDELLGFLKRSIAEKTAGRKCALALSGGIDSAILLQLVPQNTMVYTFKCVVPGMEVTDETHAAAAYLKYARPELKHCIVPVYWEDYEALMPEILRHKGEPTHSIEVQICKAARQAKKDGCDLFIFGETADCIYGGHSQLLSRDWTIGDFADRWTFVMPYKVLRDYKLIMEPYERYEKNGYIDVPAFLSDFESEPSLNFYQNACAVAGIELYAPYAHTVMGVPLDLERVRRGENKYLVREVFSRLYPGFAIPAKTPMPRPMNEWFKDWDGPVRPEFWAHCTDGMTGDQKWLVWALERFLDMIE